MPFPSLRSSPGFGAAQEFSFGSALAISAAMAFPFSSFPNIYSLLVVDDFGRPFLDTSTFLRVGTPASLFCVMLVVLWTAVRVGGKAVVEDE